MCVRGLSLSWMRRFILATALAFVYDNKCGRRAAHWAKHWIGCEVSVDGCAISRSASTCQCGRHKRGPVATPSGDWPKKCVQYARLPVNENGSSAAAHTLRPQMLLATVPGEVVARPEHAHRSQTLWPERVCMPHTHAHCPARLGHAICVCGLFIHETNNTPSRLCSSARHRKNRKQQ